MEASVSVRSVGSFASLLSREPEAAARRYLSVASRFFIVDVVQPVEAVADTELGDVLVTVRTALDFDSGHVPDRAQIDDELLLKVGLLGGPGTTGFNRRRKETNLLDTLGKQTDAHGADIKTSRLVCTMAPAVIAKSDS